MWHVSDTHMLIGSASASRFLSHFRAAANQGGSAADSFFLLQAGMAVVKKKSKAGGLGICFAIPGPPEMLRAHSSLICTHTGKPSLGMLPVKQRSNPTKIHISRALTWAPEVELAPEWTAISCISFWTRDGCGAERDLSPSPRTGVFQILLRNRQTLDANLNLASKRPQLLQQTPRYQP